MSITETDDEQRSWRPEDKATEDQMETVLDILIDAGSISQVEIADRLSAQLGLKVGTARAATSASLLFFRKAGWVIATRQYEKSTVWSLIA